MKHLLILSLFLLSLSVLVPASAVTITSMVPGNNWEQAMVSGNGNQGIMVPGKPRHERLVINHTKLWVPAQSVAPDVPDMTKAVEQSRRLAREGNLKAAGSVLWNSYGEGNAALFPKEDLIRNGPRFGLNYVHPAAYLEIKDGGKGDVRDFSRTCDFETGEVTATWTDDSGTHQREIFCDRINDLTLIRLTSSEPSSAMIHLMPRPGWNPKDISAPILTNDGSTASLAARYLHKYGRAYHDGYKVQLKIVTNGRIREVDGKSRIEGATETLIFLRTNYLNDFSKLAPTLSLPDEQNYDVILKAHAAIHGEMFRRVSLDLGGNLGDSRSTEEILAEAESKGPTPAYLELIHASGRYCLISSSGSLPPTLMGIWGDSWKPQWWGHYTLDSNLQLAVSNGNVGNLPEAMDSFFTWIESLYPSWERNAHQLYGARGYQGAIAHGWRHGIAIAGWHEWTGCAPWMATFFWQHYLFTGDEEFLAKRAVPLLENIVLFYQDFLKGQEGTDGKFFIFPSVSPENAPKGQGSRATPNSTSEIALIHETFRALITSYKTLGIKEDRIAGLEAFLAKVPNYRINEEGALAEWSFPGIPENYNHRHNSHLIALYPGVSITPATPQLYEASKVAIAKRIGSGQGNKSAHGYMELGFAGARLQSPKIVWNMLDDYAREKFINTAFISSHNPNHRIYNLDSILALPAIFTEMCLYSYDGHLNLLPGISEDHLSKGSIKGILARTGIVIDELSWDLPAKKIILKLTSKTDQTVTMSSRLGILSAAEIHLKANELRSVSLKIE